MSKFKVGDIIRIACHNDYPDFRAIVTAVDTSVGRDYISIRVHETSRHCEQWAIGSTWPKESVRYYSLVSALEQLAMCLNID